ncbi:hypothetical protein GCM10008931_05450 [Oceanobacillus oncorhynchi subsp. oncorhynchi]
MIGLKRDLIWSNHGVSGDTIHYKVSLLILNIFFKDITKIFSCIIIVCRI